MKDNTIYLRHILDAIGAIEMHLTGLSYEAFETSRLLYDAVLMEFIVIGEQVSSLTEEFREKHSDMPWHKMVGMRNEISHSYYNIDAKVVWDAYKQDLPQLKQYVLNVLGE